jgi:hypothetical protein
VREVKVKLQDIAFFFFSFLGGWLVQLGGPFGVVKEEEMGRGSR